jgi:RecB family endonuclease NucS
VTRPLGLTCPGDLVVVDLAATAVNDVALRRLMRHVYTLRRRCSAARVHGLLVADGISVSTRRALWEQGFDYVSLSELGFRDYLATRPDVSRLLDTAEGAVPHPTSLALDLPV